MISPPAGEGPAFIVRTDGAARGNPGPASAGAALFRADRPDARDPRAVPDASISDYLGIQTNNVAEYTALVLALEEAQRLGDRKSTRLNSSHATLSRMPSSA